MTGIDPCRERVDFAQQRLQNYLRNNPNTSRKLKYKCRTVEDENNDEYNLVVASEVLEHVKDYDVFLEKCSQKVCNSGHMLITTINQTIMSYLMAIFAAERVLNLVDRGTHTYEKFVSPESVEHSLLRSNLKYNNLEIKLELEKHMTTLKNTHF